MLSILFNDKQNAYATKHFIRASTVLIIFFYLYNIKIINKTISNQELQFK